MEIDSLAAEVRATREAYAARFGFDPHAIVRDLQEQARASGAVDVSLPPRRPKPAGYPVPPPAELAGPAAPAR